MQQAQRLIPLAEVMQLTSLSESTIARLEKQSAFPARHRISRQRVAWDIAAVQAWIDERTAGTRLLEGAVRRMVSTTTAPASAAA